MSDNDELQRARDLIDEDRRAREMTCMAEVAEALKRHNCALDVAVQPAEVLTIRLSIVVRAL